MRAKSAPWAGSTAVTWAILDARRRTVHSGTVGQPLRCLRGVDRPLYSSQEDRVSRRPHRSSQSVEEGHDKHPYRPPLAPGAALRLAAAPLTGVAQADNGAAAGDGSNAAVSALGASGIGGDNFGNSSTTQRRAVGAGASNQSDLAQAAAFTAIDQHHFNPAVDHTDLWSSLGPGVTRYDRGERPPERAREDATRGKTRTPNSIRGGALEEREGEGCTRRACNRCECLRRYEDARAARRAGAHRAAARREQR